MNPPESNTYLPGKLPPGVLSRMLEGLTAGDQRVLVGPRIGEDAAAIDFRKTALVVASDPVTFAIERIGWYAVCINANDIAVMGAEPRWFFATLLLPPDKAADPLVQSLFDDLKTACEELGIALCGGHTEITPSVIQPVISGTMLGECPRERLVTSSGARAGDVLILTKALAIEGTAILAGECRGDLEGKVPEGTIERAGAFLKDPGISVIREAAAASKTGLVHAMHDPTEGGLASAAREMALASRVGMRIYRESLPVREETRAICERLKIDPLGLISSGALLLSCPDRDADKVLQAIESEGIDAGVIGEVLPEPDGLTLKEGGESFPFPVFKRDELARYLEGKAGSR